MHACMVVSQHSAKSLMHNALTHAGAFSPGVPSTFLANYAAAVSFLEGLEAEHVRTRRQLDSFRGAPAVATFLKRWNLSVYFSLRFQVSECRLQTLAKQRKLFGPSGVLPARCSRA